MSTPSKSNFPFPPEQEAPTVAEIAAATSEHQEQKRGDSTAAFTLRPVARDRALPLSFAQQRLWFLDQYEPGSSVYNIHNVLRLTGTLNVSALEQSVQEIVNRHEALRTTFAMADGEAVQVIAPALTLTLPVVDLSETLEDQREAEALRLAKEEDQLPFDLSRGPLFRICLIRLTRQDHFLLLTLHHIVADGWSMAVLYRELSVLYKAFSQGTLSPLTDLPIQYADFAVWQRQWLTGEVLETQLSYWRKQLQAIPAIINLPIDRPRPKVQSYRGARQSIELSKELTRGLRALSRSHNVTLYMTLLAAFQTLLSRYTGQENIAVGSPIAGRTREETEGLIGFFVNTLVLRADLSGNLSFTALLRQVRETTLEAYTHQDVPFEKLVEELHPDRNLGASPLFQVMFVFQNNADQPLEFESLAVNPIGVESQNAKFDLTLALSERGGQLSGGLSYNTDLFDESTIQRMTGHLKTLLEGIVANPEQRISQLPVLNAVEKHQLLVEWNDTTSEYAKNKFIHELFEAQVEKTPDSIALVFESRQLSYRELNDRANQLANYLKKLGIGAESHVGICMERSLELIIGLLGILKAGGAYVPLDPSYPVERLKFMLDDAQVSVLLTQARLLEDGGAGIDCLAPAIQRVCLDRDWDLIAKESAANPENLSIANNLAYVIYTSGSTGQPKGVAIEHQNTMGFLSWVHSTFTQEELSGVLASTSICFDLSVFELFAPLTCGGMVILADNALALTTIASRSKVSLINTVPSAMNELLRLEAIPPSVRVINLAGEPLRPELVRRIYESTSASKVHDLYGPSECTTYSTWTLRSAEGRQTIGRPIANTQVYILDANRNPVPIGVVGEIHIGGDGVARGYLNRPELTAERFIYHSFDGEPAQRLYRTGDLARYLSDGNIEFLGRTDKQIKIRGFRVELGEIEAVLAQHPRVREAIVIAGEDSNGDKRLVAYIVPRESPPAPNELRAHLKTKLPDYMVPSALVFLDSLPLTPNGKVDHSALPSPDRDAADSKQLYVAPGNASEQAIADIWVEILGVKRISVHDNFFDLGGHSLKATQVVSRLRDMFQCAIPLRHMFEFPTISELAAAIDSKAIDELNGDKLDRLLGEVEEMSEEEAQKLLAHTTAARNKH